MMKFARQSLAHWERQKRNGVPVCDTTEFDLAVKEAAEAKTRRQAMRARKREYPEMFRRKDESSHSHSKNEERANADHAVSARDRLRETTAVSERRTLQPGDSEDALQETDIEAEDEQVADGKRESHSRPSQDKLSGAASRKDPGSDLPVAMEVDEPKELEVAMQAVNKLARRTKRRISSPTDSSVTESTETERNHPEQSNCGKATYTSNADKVSGQRTLTAQMTSEISVGPAPKPKSKSEMPAHHLSDIG